MKKVDFYVKMNNLKKRLEIIVDDDLLLLDEIAVSRNNVNDSNNNDYVSHQNEEEFIEFESKIEHDFKNLNYLKYCLDYAFNLFQKRFLLWSLNLSEKQFYLIFYSNTESEIDCKKKYNKYVLLFHPDKFETNKDLLGDIFIKLTELKTNIVYKSLKKVNAFDRDNFKAEGINYFNLAMDYYYCSIQMFSKVKILNLDGSNDYKSEFFQSLAKVYFENASEKFRYACLIADEEKNYNEMLDLRIRISQCFCKDAKRKLETQLAAFACIYLVTKMFPDKFNQEQKEIARKNFDELTIKIPQSKVNIIIVFKKFRLI
jgi:hypothetical protein